MTTAVDPPIFIVVRDRVSDLRHLVSWLERAGHERITLLDNASTWPPLLKYLKESPHNVVKLGTNLGSQALWQAGMVPDERFVVTDPDVLPTEDCPLDLIAHLDMLLTRYTKVQKVGVGLYLDDLPEVPMLDWERSLVSPDRELEPGVFDSLVDTTLALYEPGAAFALEALRTGAPYQARHEQWYRSPNELDEEERYYREHALKGPGGTTTWENQGW